MVFFRALKIFKGRGRGEVDFPGVQGRVHLTGMALHPGNARGVREVPFQEVEQGQQVEVVDLSDLQVVFAHGDMGAYGFVVCFRGTRI